MPAPRLPLIAALLALGPALAVPHAAAKADEGHDRDHAEAHDHGHDDHGHDDHGHDDHGHDDHAHDEAADDHDHDHAHVHGQAQLSIVFDGFLMDTTLTLPGGDLFADDAPHDETAAAARL